MSHQLSCFTGSPSSPHSQRRLQSRERFHAGPCRRSLISCWALCAPASFSVNQAQDLPPRFGRSPCASRCCCPGRTSCGRRKSAESALSGGAHATEDASRELKAVPGSRGSRIQGRPRGFHWCPGGCWRLRRFSVKTPKTPRLRDVEKAGTPFSSVCSHLHGLGRLRCCRPSQVKRDDLSSLDAARLWAPV